MVRGSVRQTVLMVQFRDKFSGSSKIRNGSDHAGTEEAHSMSNSLEKRVYRLEQLVAKKNEKPLVCNCRSMTRSHGSNCLDAIMKGTSRVCPFHGFRELGGFMWTPEDSPLLSEDNQFCPCPPNPVRSFLLSAVAIGLASVRC